MQEPSSPLDRRMKKFADAIAKMNEAMSDVISGMEAIPFAFHPHQQKNAFIMGVLRDKDECNLFQTISNTMLMEYDGTKYQLSLLEHAKLVDRYTVRYFDSNSKKITNVEYLVPHKNIPEINPGFSKNFFFLKYSNTKNKITPSKIASYNCEGCLDKSSI